MQYTKSEINYATECDLTQLQTIFCSALDKLLLGKLQQKQSDEQIVAEAVQLGYLEQEVVLRMQNIRASGILQLL